MDWRIGRRKQRERDLRDEIAHDLALEAEEQMRAGLPAEEAGQISRREFGNVLHVEEDVRETWGWTSLDRLAQDVRYGWRTLCKNPLFTAMAVLTLALGIGANTAIYSIIDAIMIRALPVRNPSELVILNWRAAREPLVIDSHNGSEYDEPGGGKTSPDFPWPAYELLRDHNTVFTSLFAYQDTGQLNVSVRGQAEVSRVELVSANFFSGLGEIPAAGRLLDDRDTRADGSQVAVLSYNLWQDRFAGDPAAVGQTIRINSLPFTIVGVAPPGFFGLKPGVTPGLYVPIGNRPSLARNYGNERETMFVNPRFYWVGMMGRLRPGITLAHAQAELAARFQQFALTSATNPAEIATLPELRLGAGGSGVDSLRRQYAKPLWILMIMVAFILAIACANIANLLLARASARRREIAVRLSLGAGRLRVMRQLLTESILLALPGGVLGVGVAAGGVRFLLWLLAAGSADFSLHVPLDWQILGLTLAVACLTGIAFGLAPALQATRVDITPALKEARGSVARQRGRHPGLTQILIVSQIALSLLLVIGAAFFVRTLANLHSVAMGFNPERLLTFRLDAGQAGYQGVDLTALYAGIHERFQNLPGVRAATMSDIVLVSGGSYDTRILLPGAPQQEGRGGPSTSYATVGPAFFETMQIPILLGRPILSSDVAGAPVIAVINETLARKYFPDRNPIGAQFTLGNTQARKITIVGVAKNARYGSLKGAVPPVAYIPFLQDVVRRPPVGIFFELRTASDPLTLVESVRKVVRETAPGVPVTHVMTQSQRIDATIVPERTFANLCTAFAILALSIACVGLYGAMAYAVSRRTNEIGIRMALGAKRGGIVWMVLREVLALAAAGIALGLAGAWSAKSVIASFLFGVQPADPLTIVLATAVLTGALLLAGYAPAVRAARVDPLAALRHE